MHFLFFETEVLCQQADKYRQFVIGLCSQLENITSNDLLKLIMTGKSDVDIQKQFAERGIHIVNTAFDKLGTSGDAFEQFDHAPSKRYIQRYGTGEISYKS